MNRALHPLLGGSNAYKKQGGELMNLVAFRKQKVQRQRDHLNDDPINFSESIASDASEVAEVCRNNSNMMNEKGCEG